jgi:hypothetical protein
MTGRTISESRHPFLPRRGAIAGCVILFLLTLLPPVTLAQKVATPEYQIKAAFLFNFTRFVRWPASRLPRPDTPIVIGVLGRNPFGNTLTEAVRGRKVDSHPLVVRMVQQPSEVAAVHVLFVPAAETARAAAMADLINRSAILGVGETPAFLDSGGTIVFSLIGDKVRFDINLAAAEASGLRLNPQLLKLARSVRQSR